MCEDNVEPYIPPRLKARSSDVTDRLTGINVASAGRAQTTVTLLALITTDATQGNATQVGDVATTATATARAQRTDGYIEHTHGSLEDNISLPQERPSARAGTARAVGENGRRGAGEGGEVAHRRWRMQGRDLIGR